MTRDFLLLWQFFSGNAIHGGAIPCLKGAWDGGLSHGVAKDDIILPLPLSTCRNPNRKHITMFAVAQIHTECEPLELK